MRFFHCLFPAALVCLAACLRELVTAGSIFKTAVNTTDAFLYLIDSHAFHELRNRFQVAVTATGEFYIVYDIAVQLQFNQRRAGAFCSICVVRCQILLCVRYVSGYFSTRIL